MSFDRLIERIIELKNPTVVGLDPKLEYVPEYIQRRYLDDDGWTLKAAAKAIFAFNQMIIDEIHDIVPAIKPQAAYYEMYGHYGIKAMERTIRYAKLNGMFVITDGKRNDIGATMEAYTNAHLGSVTIGDDNDVEPFGADALTVNGYLGTDGISPLLKVCRERDKGIYVLVKTSNPSSGELQDKKINGVPVYEQMAKMCTIWGKELAGKYGYCGVGIVAGATYPEQGKALRKIMPKSFILVPGYGAQGGKGADLVHFFNKDGLGAIINSSRGIIAAYRQEAYAEYGEENYADAARAAVLAMKKDIEGSGCLG